MRDALCLAEVCDEDLAAPPGEHGRHPLPEPGDFAAAASRAGIGDGVFVVAYGVMGPHVFLVGKDGKVANTNAQIPVLADEVEKMLK